VARQIYLLPREYKRRTRPRTVEDRQREKITELTHLRAEVQIRFSAWGLRGKPPYPPGGFPDIREKVRLKHHTAIDRASGRFKLGSKESA
jgi:hypothetical protein